RSDPRRPSERPARAPRGTLGARRPPVGARGTAVPGGGRGDRGSPRAPGRRRPLPGAGARRPPHPVAADLRLRHTSVRTPLGRLTIVATDLGVVGAELAEDPDRFIAWAEARFDAAAVRDTAGLEAPRAEVRAYFAGELRRFRTPLDLSPVRTPFF